MRESKTEFDNLGKHILPNKAMPRLWPGGPGADVPEICTKFPLNEMFGKLTCFSPIQHPCRLACNSDGSVANQTQQSRLVVSL
mmetsp:Transcript_40579/g.63362  ORF Transcript_40579/g.63362 Transcript_40579/m.63362 type:complete len:83 (-) Transcript_40579:99-347(-)